MKRIKSAHIVTIVFAVVLIGGIWGFFNLNSFLKPIGASILLGWDSEKSASKNISAIEGEIENIINENVGLKTSFIQVNGAVNKLMNKRLVDDVDTSSRVVKLDNGYISFVAPQIDDSALQTKADSIGELNLFLENKGIDFLYVQAPYKIDEHDQKLPYDIKDYSVNNARRFCSMLNKGNVKTLNLIDLIHEQDKDWYGLYYKTDHHWTNEAAFWAYGELAKHLSDNFSFEINSKYYDINNYSVRSYEQAFLGTQGKRVGSIYSGLDDINFLIPKFETSLEYQRESVLLKGDFDATLLFDENYVTGDKFKDFCYEASMGGNYGYIKVTNNLETNGKKVLLIKDSYANPVATFLALGVSELEIVDPRYFEDEMGMSITEYIDKSNPDIVLMLYNPNALKDNTFFKY